MSTWRRPGACESSACVEVAFSGDHATVRESRHGRYSQILTFDEQEWLAFVAAVKAGEFDWPEAQ